MRKQGTTGGFLVSVEIILLVATLFIVLVKPFGSSKKTEEEKGWSNKNDSNSESQNMFDDTQDTEPLPSMFDDDSQSDTKTVGEPERLTFSQKVEDKIADMTLEEQISQMFIITPEELTGVDQVNVSGEGTKNAIQKYPVGGLVYSAKNFQGTEQTTVMLSNVQEYIQDRIGLPLFLAIEEEGGENYSPLAKSLNYNIVAYPSLWDSADTAGENAGKIASYLAQCGFNMNIASMLDRDSGSDNEYDKRSRGSETVSICELLAAEVQAYKEDKIESVVKFFPEKSSAAKDANGYLVSSRSLEDVKNHELTVLSDAIEAGADVIMVSNIVDTQLTAGKEVPCCMSSSVIDILRNDLNYQGLIMTDSLSEEAITAHYSSEEAAVAAVNAGVDILYMPEDYEEAYQAVIDGVNDGSIYDNTIHNAVGRVLTEKYEMGEE